MLSLPFSLLAQDRYIIIPEAKAQELKQYKVTWHWGVDPVQIKSGEWIISEHCYKLIKELFIDKITTLETAQKAAYFRQEVNKYPIREVLKTEFREIVIQ